MIFIIRLFPEITIKSASVRKRWSKKLVDNLRILGRRIDETTTVVLDWDRIVLRTKGDDTLADAMISMLANTPGIANFSQVQAYRFETMHDIYEHTFKHWHDRLNGKSFCVRVKRSGKHDFNSSELERYVGGGLHQHTANSGVKLKHPDETVHIEVKDDQCYVVDKRLSGLGGFPLGTQDDVISLVSGGFDSTVASYLFIRRGLKTHFCFFNLGGREHETAVKELAFYLWNTFASSHRVKFISVPFEEIVGEIVEKISPSNMGVVLKRMMLRAADKVMSYGKYSAMVTGEAISQVSSQTLPNLNAIDEVTDKLVLRPLIAMDKPEIINIARKIGTEEFLVNIPEYCGVISIKPSANVNMEKLLAEETLFDLSLIDQAVETAQVQTIDEVMEDAASNEKSFELVEMPLSNDIVIDVRHPTEAEVRPILFDASSQHAKEKIIPIPFYQLDTKWSQLDKDQRYLLYCQKGVMSQLHAQHLIDQGFHNVAVYRPAKKTD